jgi:hypothetical protein
MASRRIGWGPLPPLLVVGAAFVGLLLASSAALAAGSKGRPHPQPQQLWNAYPLDAKGSQEQLQKPSAPATAPETTPRQSGGGSSSLLLVWISLAAFGASLLAFAVSWRASPRLRPALRALILAGDNVRAFGVGLAAEMRLLRRAPAERLALVAPTEPSQLTRLLTDVLHERLHALPAPPEEPQATNGARERAVLKEKRAEAALADVRKLKDKTRAAARETDRRDEVGILKAKLADSPESAPGATPATRWMEKGER